MDVTSEDLWIPLHLNNGGEVMQYPSPLILCGLLALGMKVAFSHPNSLFDGSFSIHIFPRCDQSKEILGWAVSKKQMK